MASTTNRRGKKRASLVLAPTPFAQREEYAARKSFSHTGYLVQFLRSGQSDLQATNLDWIALTWLRSNDQQAHPKIAGEGALEGVPIFYVEIPHILAPDSLGYQQQTVQNPVARIL